MIEVQVTNPNDIRLRITAEHSIATWEEILATTKDVKYYAPLHEMLRSIGVGINAIKQRARINERNEVSE